MDVLTDLIVIIKNEQDIPLATLAEGHLTGEALRIKKGPFHLQKTILLPRYLCSGNYYLDIIFKQPTSEYQMGARLSVFLHAEGNADRFGKPLKASTCGLLGLETTQQNAE